MSINSPIPSLTNAFTAMSAGQAIAQEVLQPNKFDAALEAGLGALGR